MNDRNGYILADNCYSIDESTLQKSSYRFYVKEHLKHKSDISSFFIRNNSIIRFSGLYCSILGRKNDLPYSRIAVTVKKNKANAVKRNRAKRIIREIFRIEKQSIKSGYDYFIFVNRPYGYSFQIYKEDLMELFHRF